MGYLNKALVMGNVGFDPDVKEISSGLVVKFRVATNKRWTTKDGEKKESTTWHSISVFGKLAEFAKTHIKRASVVYVEGEIRMDEWEKDDGSKGKAFYIVADNIQLLSKAQQQPGVSQEPMSQPSGHHRERPVAQPKPVKNYAPGADNSHLDDPGF